MSDWNPSIVKIEKIVNHPNADALDIVTVLGDYPVITKRNEYKVGDIAAYLPIDTIVPDIDQFYFLCPKQYEKYEDNGEIKQHQLGFKYSLGSVPEKYRILKAKKIRDIYSQGLLLPAPINTEVGQSVVELMQLKKWEEEEEENIQTPKLKGKNALSPPQGWSIPYYDIEGLRKYISCLRSDEEIVLTEKIHGSNSSFVHDGNKLWVKSRNFFKKMDPEDSWWEVAIRLDLENKLSKFPNLVFFGELYGQVKGFRYDTTVSSGKLLTNVRFFDIFDLKLGKYLDYDLFVQIINEAGLQATPELYRGFWQDKDYMYSFAEGPTTLGGKHVREGFILRTVKERFEPKLQSRMQVKLVGQGYNLQK